MERYSPALPHLPRANPKIVGTHDAPCIVGHLASLIDADARAAGYAPTDAIDGHAAAENEATHLGQNVPAEEIYTARGKTHIDQKWSDVPCMGMAGARKNRIAVQCL